MHGIRILAETVGAGKYFYANITRFFGTRIGEGSVAKPKGLMVIRNEASQAPHSALSPRPALLRGRRRPARGYLVEAKSLLSAPTLRVVFSKVTHIIGG